jgi:hypothetical protein
LINRKNKILFLFVNRFDFNKKIISTEAMINLDVANKYDLSGKLMILPIKSNGDSSIKLSKLYIIFYDFHQIRERTQFESLTTRIHIQT